MKKQKTNEKDIFTLKDALRIAKITWKVLVAVCAVIWLYCAVILKYSVYDMASTTVSLMAPLFLQAVFMVILEGLCKKYT